MAVKKFNIDLDIQGKLGVTNVPNASGDLLTYNGQTVSRRTYSQIISDLKLAETTWVNTNFIPKSHPTFAVTQAQINNWDTNLNRTYSFAEITNKPTTIAGYGITDAYSKTESDNKFVPYTGGTLTGNLSILTGNTDKYITFDYDGTNTYNWRIGYLGTGSGNANYFTIQSSKSTGGVYFDALRLELDTLNARFLGTVTAPTFIGDLTGNATTASTLATARTIALSGGATGTATSFNGSANITIPVTGLNADNLDTGTIPLDRLKESYGAIANQGPILTLGTITSGTGYTDGTYTNVLLTGGTGAGAVASITIENGSIAAVSLVDGGAGFIVGDSLTAKIASIGGTGSGFSVLVATVRTATIHIKNAEPRIRLENNNTRLTAGQEIGSVLFSSLDSSTYGRGDNVRLIGVAEGTMGGGALQIWTAANAGQPTLAAAFHGNNDFRLYNALGTFYHSIKNSPTANRTLSLPDANVTLVSGTMVPTTGTGATGTWKINISGSATSLAKARTLKIGSTGKTFDGSGNVSWTLDEIGAMATTHAANAISATNITNWNTAFEWENHATQGYLKLADLNGQATQTWVTDNFIPTSHPVNAITGQNITNWNTAFTNNHTHTNKSVLDGIASANVTNWNNAHSYSQVGHIPLTQKGAANGVASLDSNGQVPSEQLPSYVDDVIEAANLTALNNLPLIQKMTGKIYVTLDTNRTYRWSGTQFIMIATGEVDSVNGKKGVVSLTSTDIPEGTNQYFTTARARASIAEGTGITYSSSTGAISVKYGTTAGTAAQGNDSRINNGQTAFGWDNHATQGYLKLANLPNPALVTSTTATGTTNTTTTNTNTFLNIVYNGGSIGSSTQITGAGSVTVSSDTAGKLIITGTNTTYLAGTLPILQATTPTTTNYLWSSKNLNDWINAKYDSKYIKKEGDTITGPLSSANYTGTSIKHYKLSAFENVDEAGLYDINSKKIATIGNSTFLNINDYTYGNGAIVVSENTITDRDQFNTNIYGELNVEKTLYSNHINVSGSSNRSVQIFNNEGNLSKNDLAAGLQFQHNTTKWDIASMVDAAGNPSHLVIKNSVAPIMALKISLGNALTSYGSINLTGDSTNYSLFGLFQDEIPRWKFGASNTADKNFQFIKYNDAGGYNGVAVEINRATGKLTGNGGIESTGYSIPGKSNSDIVLAGGETIPVNSFSTTSWVSSNFIPKSHPTFNITQAQINNWAIKDGTNASGIWKHAAYGLDLNPSINGGTFNPRGGTTSLKDAFYGTVGGIVQDSNDSPNPNQWTNRIKILHPNSQGYFTELAHSFTGEEGLWHRRMVAGALTPYVKLLDTNNGVTLDTPQDITGRKIINTTSNPTTANLRLRGDTSTNPTLAFLAEGRDWGGLQFNGSFFSFTNVDGTGFKSVKATQFIRNGGTSTQVMMADGSIKELSTINGTTYTQGTNIVISGTTISVSSSPTFSGAVTATSFFESSLRKYKTNIQPFTNSALDLIGKLDIVTYDRTEGMKDKIGIIADDSPKEFLSEKQEEVDLYKTIFIQAKAIQELKREIDNLKERMNNVRL